MLKFIAFLNTLIFFPVTIIQVILGALIYLIGLLFKSKQLKLHGKDIAIAADQNMNVFWLGNPDETISSRTGRAVISKRPKWYIKYLLHPFVDKAAQFFGDEPNHCVRAIEHDENMDEQYEIWKWHK